MRALVIAIVAAYLSAGASAQGLSAEQEAAIDALWGHTSKLRDRAGRLYYDWKSENEEAYVAAIKEKWCAERSLSFATFSDGAPDRLQYWEQRIANADSSLKTLTESLSSTAFSRTRDLGTADTILLVQMVDLEHEGFLFGLRTGLALDYEARPFPGLCW